MNMHVALGRGGAVGRFWNFRDEGLAALHMIVQQLDHSLQIEPTGLSSLIGL